MGPRFWCGSRLTDGQVEKKGERATHLGTWHDTRRIEDPYYTDRIHHNAFEQLSPVLVRLVATRPYSMETFLGGRENWDASLPRWHQAHVAEAPGAR